jgi:hypothetical protein
VERGDNGILSFLQICWAFGWPKPRVFSKTGLFWGGDAESKGTLKFKERIMLIIAQETPCTTEI